MSDPATDIYGRPVEDADEARESFLAGGSGTFSGGDIGGAGLRFIGPHPTTRSQHDCDFTHGLCQLSRGHAIPHCVPDTDGSGSYLMVDDEGWILREI